MELQETLRTASFIPVSSNETVIPRKSIDPSSEAAEPHFLLEENSFPPSATIAKNDDSKRINALIDAIHGDMSKKEREQPQKASPSLILRKSVQTINTQSSPGGLTNFASSEQHARRTVTFDDDHILSQSISNRPFRPSQVDFPLSNRHSIPNDQQEKEAIGASHPSDLVVESSQTNFTTQDLNILLSEDEYIPGGFANLDQDLEDELLTDFDDEFDNQTARRSRHISSVHSSDPTSAITRSPIELWQRARILIAIHLYKIHNKIPNSHDDAFPTTLMRKITDENEQVSQRDQSNYLENLFEQKTNKEEQKILFGLSIVKQLPLHGSQQYQCVDFYDVEHGYIIMCNVVNLKYSQSNVEHEKTYQSTLNQAMDSLSTPDGKLLVYPIDKKLDNELQSAEFACPYQFHFMICIPIFRLILGFINTKKHKSLMILIGDASRQGIFLSKQELPDPIHSILYIHEASLLFLGSLGRVFSYNTQPLQFTSQPLLISELSQLPFQSIEPIIHMCQLKNSRSIGLLSHRYFLCYQYAPNEKILLKFCNPYRYDFIRGHYNSKYDYMILAFTDGLILVYQLNSMKQIRRYHDHWKMITDLKTNDKILISSSIDQLINIWNLDTLQHLYQYNANEEIWQIDILHDNLFYYRTRQNLIVFQLNLQTLLFSITKAKVLTLKLCIDMQRIARIIAVLEDNSSVIISPVSGCCLTYVPNIARKPVKQILHDISRSTVYSLQFDGEIVLYDTHNDPCVAEYKVRTKSEQYAITCMTSINPMRTHLFTLGAIQISTEKSLGKQAIFFGHANGYISLFQGRFAIVESDSSQSDDENLPSSNPDRLSIVSDDSNWSELAEDVKDILRMKKYQIQHQNK